MMSKINFTKIDEMLSSGLFKMKIEEWNRLAKIAQEVGRPEMRKILEKAAVTAAKNRDDRNSLIHGLKQAINRYKKADSEFYTFIEMPLEELKALLHDPQSLQPEGWEKLQKLRAKLRQYYELEQYQNPDGSNQNIVEKERKRHINKRFNVREKWLPL